MARWLYPGVRSPAKAVSLAITGVREAADAASARQDWTVAADLYGCVLEVYPDERDVQVQLAHSLKEAGRLRDAVAGYRAAAATAREDPEPWIHLAHLLKRMGDRSGAHEAFREALLRDSSLADPRNELIDAGARDRLPADAYGPAAAAVESAYVSRLFADAAAGLVDLATLSAYPRDAYDAFRRQYPVEPAPASSTQVSVMISATDATPARLRATLTSLMDQRHGFWRATVTPTQPLSDHSVASLAAMDDRIRFADTAEKPGGATVAAPAGAILDREALGWMVHALERTGADAVYCDHDLYSPDWRLGMVRHSPRLQPMFNAEAMASSSAPPPIAIFQSETTAAEPVIEALLALKRGRIAHLPRLLASLPTGADRPASRIQTVDTRAEEDEATLLVIIPTRDEADMLERSIVTLLAQASRPDRLSFVIVDNRSQEEATGRALQRLAGRANIEVMPLDEPFNWPRCNNRAATGRVQDILVFANNDIEMKSQGWDATLAARLGQVDAGVVGARMTYPDGALQHAGILLGGWEGRPFHEGLGAAPDEGGPMNRWRTSRQVAAVTGAFMACTRETFEAAGRFEERLAIAYNDVDFCLKVRALGKSVVFVPEIELIHYESRTRGQNDSPEKVAWDDAELADLYARWGQALFEDPGYNPQWANARNHPYDGIRDLARSQVFAHLDRSAAENPWSLNRTASDLGGA